MTALEAVFWFCALLGGSFLVLSTVFGTHGLAGDVHIPHVHVPHLHVGEHLVPSGGTASVTPMVLAFLALFGLGGLLGLNGLRMDGLRALAIGGALGILGAALAFGLFAVLLRFQAAEPTALAALAGRRGEVAVSISGGRPGQVKLLVEGTLRTFTAISSEELRRGEPALVVSVDGVRLVVRRTSA
jgi:membrane-bound ClpP family serine protease